MVRVLEFNLLYFLDQMDAPLRFRLVRVVPLDGVGAIVVFGSFHIDEFARVHCLDGVGTITN